MITDDSLDDLFNFEDISPESSPEMFLVPTPRKTQKWIADLIGDLNAPNEFETPKWEEDFESKATALRQTFEQTTPESLYIDLFGSLESKCHLLLDKGKKRRAHSFHDLEAYIQNHDDVFLYTQEFKGIGKNSDGRSDCYPKTYDALTGFRCFVVDIDKVDAGNIGSVIEKITSAPILPNYVNLTGNGVHLYFIFDTLHDVKHSAWLMAYCNKTNSASERAAYVTIKQKMISWFNGTTAESDVRNHLTQPSRLPGSKTKNRNKRTIVFRVSDAKYNIQYIAELVGVELPDEEDIRKWKKLKDAAIRKRRKEQKKSSATSTPFSFDDAFSDWVPPVPSVPEIDDHGDVSNDTDHDPIPVNMTGRFRLDFEKIRQQVIDDHNQEMQSPESRYAEQKRLRAEKRSSEGQQPLKIAQRRGLESQYKQFMEQMFDGAKRGNRADVLHVFWNRAPAYQKDTEIISHDFFRLLDHCNAKSTDKITDKQVLKIINGPHNDYSNESIFNRTGITITMSNKKTEERKQRRETREEKWRRILLICESELEINPKLSDRQLTKILTSYGIKVCHKTISTCAQLKELRTRLRMQ